MARIVILEEESRAALLEEVKAIQMGGTYLTSEALSAITAIVDAEELAESDISEIVKDLEDVHSGWTMSGLLSPGTSARKLHKVLKARLA